VQRPLNRTWARFIAALLGIRRAAFIVLAQRGRRERLHDDWPGAVPPAVKDGAIEVAAVALHDQRRLDD
jgi:hypothetical protein